MAKKIVEAADGSFSATSMTMVDVAMAAATAPLKLFSDTKEYYDGVTIGAASLGWGVAGFMLGDRFGDRIPVIGGRRQA